MPNLTARLALKKPLPNEVADIVVLNENFDIIDGQMAVLGTNNQSVNLVKALDHAIDTRTTAVTYSGGRLSKIEEKDGATVVKTTTITYDGSGRVSKITETAGGKTVTITLNYNTDGTLAGVSKAVS